MSRAFVKEPDGPTAGDEQPDLPISPHPNHVTPRGLGALKARREALAAERAGLAADDAAPEVQNRLAQLARELRYFEARIAAALVVEIAAQPKGEVAFGALVTLEEKSGARLSYRIVGEDEADPAACKVSWVSPLARALIGAKVGELVTWRRPNGDLDLEVIAIAYEGDG